ncbi:MAG TPA: SDR family oxidoreductase [Candidatus Andersenbacteria bacterium]|nr:SDR family oxidoreductase [Candidatus Andersenbacteria bacterium]
MSNIQYDFTGKVAIVTGGASGIGKATVKMFAEAGANVVLVDVNKGRGETVAEELGERVCFVFADVARTRHAEEVAQRAMLAFGKIDILVNNAGIEYNDRGNLVTMPHDDMMRIIQVNLFGYIHMVRACLPHMNFGGRVVNVSSLQGLAAALPGTSYQSTKAAILGMTRALAIEYALEGITFNSVCPGAICTEGMGAARAGGSASLDPTRRRIPMGRRGWPHEVAALIAFLASDAASYMTGGDYVVDGGLLISLSADDPSKPTPNVSNDPDR